MAQILSYFSFGNSPASRVHTQKINKMAYLCLWANAVMMVVAAWAFGTSMPLAGGVGSCIALLPILVQVCFKSPFVTSYVVAFCAMSMSGLLIHVGKGMIEMHFHVFVFLATLCVYGNPWVPIIGTLTIALHHLGFFFFLPQSVFNYNASLQIVILHAAFVIIETIPAVYISVAFKRLLEAQAIIEGGVKVTVDEISSATQKLFNESQAQISQSQLQTATVQQTNAALTEIHSQLNLTVENITDCSQLSKKVSEKTIQGTQDIDHLSKSMMGISESNDQLKLLQRSIDEISHKTNMINDIVMKSQMLSFNASIEAARAGESGKGFAVVADEVGTLAKISGKSALQISTLIAETREFVAKVILENQNRVKIGLEATQSCSDTFNQIEKMSAEIATKLASINETSAEQEKGVKESTRSMGQVAEITLKTQQIAEAVGNISGEIEAQKNTLQQKIADTRQVLYGLKDVA